MNRPWIRSGLSLWFSRAALILVVATQMGAAQDTLDDSSPPRPRVLLYVDGSAVMGVLWRGWPVLIQGSALSGELPTSLAVQGPSDVKPSSTRSGWVISSEDSARLSPGRYTLTLGEAKTEVTVSDPPAVLTPRQVAAKRRLLFQVALQKDNLTEARAVAESWIGEQPKDYEGHSALGDVLRLSGDPRGAAQAYGEAMARVPQGAHPSLRLHRLYSEMLNAVAATPPKVGAAPPAASTSRSVASAPSATAVAPNALPAAGPTPGAGGTMPSPGSPAAVTPPGPSAAPVSALPAASSAGPLVAPSELGDAVVRADPAGQWAVAAQARTQYGNDGYSASQATGAPNVPIVGNSPQAWCPATRQGGLDWLELTFARPVHATEVRVRQTDAPGGLAKVEAFEPDGTAHTWWEGVDPHRPAGRDILWFAVRVPRTSYLVARIKLTLNLDAGPGYKQIDAVQLVAAP